MKTEIIPFSDNFQCTLMEYMRQLQQTWENKISASTGATKGGLEPCGLFLALPLSPIFIRNAATSSPWPTKSSCACWSFFRWAWCSPTAIATEAGPSRDASRVDPTSRSSRIFCQLCLSLASSGPNPPREQKIRSSSLEG